MIGLLTGSVAEIVLPNIIIVDVGGVGYVVHCPNDLIAESKIGSEIKLSVHTAVREDSITLYGFKDKSDKEGFEALLSTQGVGPSLALNILSSLSRAELALAIDSRDQAALTRVPGVGSKTASRLLVEMAGQLSKLDSGGIPARQSGNIDANLIADLRMALSSLGYGADQIRRVVEQVPSGLSLQELIKHCLKELSS